MLEKIIVIWTLLVGAIAIAVGSFVMVYTPSSLIKHAIRAKEFPNGVELFIIFISIAVLPLGIIVIGYLMLLIYQSGLL